MKKEDLTQDEFEEGVVSEIMRSTPEIQQAVYQVGHLNTLIFSSAVFGENPRY